MGIERVYHTLIVNPKLEARVEAECGIDDGLKGLPTPQQAQRLFLEVYDHAQFDIVAIPVIRLQAEQEMTRC